MPLYSFPRAYRGPSNGGAVGQFSSWMRPMQRMLAAPGIVERPIIPAADPGPVWGSGPDARDTASLSSSAQAVVREAIRRYDSARLAELTAAMCASDKTLVAARLAGAQVGRGGSFLTTAPLPTGYTWVAPDPTLKKGVLGSAAYPYARYTWTPPPDALVQLLAYGTLAQLRTWMFANTDPTLTTPHFTGPSVGLTSRGGVGMPRVGLDFGWFEAVRGAIESLSIAQGLAPGSVWWCPPKG